MNKLVGSVSAVFGIHRRDAEFAEKSWGEMYLVSGLKAQPKTGRLRAFCVSAVNRRLVGLAMALAVASAAVGAERLVVYADRSFAKWGPATAIEQAFEAAHPGVDLVWVAPAGGAEMLSRLIAEIGTGKTEADVFLGITAASLPRALAHDVFRPYDPALIPNLTFVPEELLFDTTGRVIPFDHGYVTLVASAALPEDLVPHTFQDLLRPELKGKIILQDPRTSETGLAFLLWTVSHFGDGWPAFWKALLPNTLTITKGWSEAFAMFEAGEAPIVLSYSTDAAYAYITTGTAAYRVLTLDGEGYRLVEGMGIVSTTAKLDLAHAFLNIVLSREIQELIPTSQWMFPVHEEVELPSDFARYAVLPEVPVFLSPTYAAEHLEEWLNRWQQVLGEL
ncbi:MAG: thiamine ABC transporter substrate-binding protein [Candidatus Bipolaricaulota bacterium]